MRLTDRSRWKYSEQPLTRDGVAEILRREQWLAIVRELLPQEPMRVLELGCAPGRLSAALTLDKPWEPHGIDYSDDSQIYIETLRAIGKDPVLHKFDLFEERLSDRYDCVCSFGLIEHFRGTSLDELLALHDDYLLPGGYLVISVPNFTGYQYFWHYVFDRPDLDNHNVDVMRPETFKFFMDRRYQPLYNGYHGLLRLWGNTSWNSNWFTGKAVAALGHGISACARLLANAGIKLQGRSFSPYYLYVGRKPAAEAELNE